MNQEPDGQNFDGQGGSYVVDGAGQHTLVERTKQLHEVQVVDTTAVIDPNDPEMMERIAAGVLTKIDEPAAPAETAVQQKPAGKRATPGAATAEPTTTE